MTAHKTRSSMLRALCLAALFLTGPAISDVFALAVTSNFVSYSTIDWQTGTSDYGYGNGINTIAFRNNSLYTVGNYQFTSYYNAAGYLVVARRDLTTNTWVGITTTGTADSIIDDHDVISFGIDGNGYMHLSWGMHQSSTMHYAISNASVLGTSFTNTSFTASPIAGVGDNNTYPEFYNLANGDLLFAYRNGSSSSGNMMVTTYNAATKSWSGTVTLVLNGTSTDTNGYTNSLVVANDGSIKMSWVWREDYNFQTNHDIMYATSSTASLTTWKTITGSTQTCPITKSNASTAVVIAQNSSLMNQSSMTTDLSGNPVIATYWAPNLTTRQYMLAWWDSTTNAWRTSQISNRPTETKITDNSATRIREVGRPIVVVDEDGRTIVVTRSNDTSNHVTAYYSNSKETGTWTQVQLTDTDSGRYEPTYDEVMWKKSGILSLYYEAGFATTSGAQSSGAQEAAVVDWNALRYTRTNITCSFTGATADWGDKSNWSNVAAKCPSGVWSTVQFGNQAAARATVDLGTAAKTAGTIYFSGTTSTTVASTAGYALTMNNSGANAMISVSGTHAIGAAVVLASDLDLTGTGKINLNGGVSGGYKMNLTGVTANAKNLSVGAVNVNGGAVFNGSGTVAGLTVASSGTASAGQGVGSLTVNGSASFGGNLIAEISGNTAGTGYDQITVNGGVTLSGILTTDLNSAFKGTLSDKLWLILNDGTDSVSGAFANLAEGATAFSVGSIGYQIHYGANYSTGALTGGNDVVLAAVPEPAALMALAGGLCCWAFLRRRK